MMWKDWLNYAILCLHMSDSPRCDAEIILEHVIKTPRSHFLAFDTKLLNKKQLNQANTLLVRRMKGEPIAYLIGKCEFWSLNLEIFSGIFIPRADTECLVEHVLLYFSSCSPYNILDLGSGSGAIALAIASECSNWQVTGVDFLYEAVNLSCKNAKLLKIQNVNFLLGNWFYNLKENYYDIIVSNPPYIDIHDHHLLYGDVRFEPKTALVSRNNGLADLSYICYNANRYLKLGGWLFLEHGYIQGNQVRQLFGSSGFKNITTVRDYNNNERVTYGKLDTLI